MKLKLLLPLLAFLLAWTACDDKETVAPPHLTVAKKTFTFAAAGKTDQTRIETNVEDWSAVVEPDASSWLTVKKEESALTGASLSIIASANDDSDARKGEIVIKANSLTETIVVEQMGQAPAILVASEQFSGQRQFSINFHGEEVGLEVTSNIDYEILIPEGASWIKLKENPGVRAQMVKEEYAFEIALNPSSVDRSAVITIKQKHANLKQEVTVTQKGKSDYSAVSDGDIEDDIKVKVSSGWASSFQSGSNIDKSFDGDFNTIYHSSWSNSSPDYFPITLDYNFENEESVDYLIYHPRPSGPNGRFKETEIWVSTEENPTPTKLMDFDFKGSGSATKIIFEKPIVKPKSVRFVVKSGAGDGQGFATCAEMEFYRNNPDNFDPLTLFTDKTCSELKPGVTRNDIEEVSNNLYRNIALYMYNDIYPREFRIEDYKAWPHPDDWARENKTSQFSLLDNPTGISIEKDEELIVFVGDTHGHNLSLKIQNLDLPEGDGYNNASFYPLSQGVNKIKPRNKGLGYVFYHTADYKTAPTVKIHFATGKVNGYFDSQKHEPAEWSKYLNSAVDKFFDVVGERAHLTFPTESFKSSTGNKGPELIDAYDDMVRLIQELQGYDKYDRHPVNRNYYHVMYTSYMYATSYRTAYNVGTLSHILNVNTFRSGPWGPAHETGHSYQTRPGFRWTGTTECTVNMPSLIVQTTWGNTSRLIEEDRYGNAYNGSIVQGISHSDMGVFEMLVPFWQLQLYFSNAQGFTDFYKDYYEHVRTTPNQPDAGTQQLQHVKDVCDVSGKNLLRFYTKWGFLTPVDKTIDDYGQAKFEITQSQVDDVIAYVESKGYPEVTDMIEYISDSNWESFKNKASVQKGTATKNGLQVQLSNWENVAAYEAYENDELIFVANNKSSFDLPQSATDNTKVYAIAYDGTKTEVTF